MNIYEYQDGVSKTAPEGEDKERSILRATTGLAGELGEIIEPIKKHIFHGHTLDTKKIEDEIGDLLWYVALLCTNLGIEMQDAIDGNAAKLRRRYPEGFSEERSKNREAF